MQIRDWNEDDTIRPLKPEEIEDRQAEAEAQRQREAEAQQEKYEAHQYDLYIAFQEAVETRDAHKAIELVGEMADNFTEDERLNDPYFQLLKGLDDSRKEQTVYGHGYMIRFVGALHCIRVFNGEIYVNIMKRKECWEMRLLDVWYAFEDSAVMCQTFNTLAKAANDAISYE